MGGHMGGAYGGLLTPIQIPPAPLTLSDATYYHLPPSLHPSLTDTYRRASSRTRADTIAI